MINIKLKKYIFIIFAFILSLIFSSVGYANIATDPFITKNTDKNTFEPGGRNHLFGSGRGVVSDRTGDISVVPTGNLQIGNLQIEQALIQGQYGYKTKFSGHGHEVHAPFSNSNSRNKSEEQGQALIGFTSYQMDWQGVEVHPSDGYDGPQGGGYPKPTGARDEYSYNVNGSAISVNIGFDDNRSTQDRLEDRIKAFENAWGNAKNSYDTATTNNPELNRLGNISEAISASVSGIGGLINSPLEALGASDASQGIGLARDLVTLEAMRQLPHDSQMNVASGLQSANNLHQGYQNWKKENPNAAAAVNAVTGVAEQAIRGGNDKKTSNNDIVTEKYNRQKHYGGSQTNTAAGKQARSDGEGKPCQTCGAIQISGTKTAPSPQHTPSLSEHYYDHGGHAMTPEERKNYAKNEGIKGTQCLTCQRREGGVQSSYSKYKAKEHGFK